ncbi:MAG: glycosyltransferase [Actinomycetota bacterium]|nr:glycosyltransferase [Actinomycetota bacterium]
MRICIVYDCLYPWTVGGAERWYRNLAERLVAEGHEVTYLTRLQWGPDTMPQLRGVRVLAVSRAEPLYGADGNRRVGQALRFGRGVLGHLLRHGRRYDVVHTASFPYFSVLAAAAARARHRYALLVDWHEVWSWSYWRTYLGLPGGLAGYAVQLACVHVSQRAFCFSRLHGDRLVAEGLRGAVTMLTGEYAGDLTPPKPNNAEARVVFAGRHIPEKRAPAMVPAVALARAAVPGLRGTVFGDGPERHAVCAAIAREGMEGVVDAPGFVDADEVDAALRSALCMLLPSSREGYGMVVVEAASRGTPSIVVHGEDNAAVELVEDGVNGVLARSAAPEDLAEAIVRVHRAGFAMRASTCAWFAANAQRLSLGTSLDRVAEAYADSARS